MSAIDWSSLRHAYGTADDIPRLLHQAETAPAPRRFDEEPWYALWSSLCHQSDVFTASYAAVPELVRIAALRDEAARAELLLLAGCIELERHESRAPAMPAELAPPYQRALEDGALLAQRSLGEIADSDCRQRLEIALAAFAGDLSGARALVDADLEEDDAN
ncbi:MAG: hypothetical protein SF182_07200 [Deltaproteobacteria bacterium]|nr:hypothetical protein [Deltaproteobacteria bacterium]